MENTGWLELLRNFTNVKDLYLCKEPAVCVARVLQELTGGTATVLPALRCIFVKGDQQLATVQTTIWPFISVRQLPVAVYIWE